LGAQSLYTSRSYLGDYFRRMRARLGPPAAITAAAHKIARILYHLITTLGSFIATAQMSLFFRVEWYTLSKYATKRSMETWSCMREDSLFVLGDAELLY
jgi:hypothetical protein